MSRLVLLLCFFLASLTGNNQVTFRLVTPACCKAGACCPGESDCCKKKLELTLKEKNESAARSPAATPQVAAPIAFALAFATPVDRAFPPSLRSHEEQTVRDPPPKSSTIRRF